MVKVIYILSHTPPYDNFIKNHRPPVYFEIDSKTWVGIFEQEWGHKLGSKILKYSNDIKFEFWRPDHRADKVYEYTFNNGLTHKVFPAELISVHKGIKVKTVVNSRNIVEEIRKLNANYVNDIVLHIGVKGKVPFEISKNAENIPIIGSFHGEIKLPQHYLKKFNKDLLSYFFLIKDYVSYKRAYKNYNLITYQTDRNVSSLKSIFKGPLRKITMGVDFNSFKPGDKKEARKKLNLPLNKKILISVSRFNPNKQIDKLIQVLSELDVSYNFLFIAIGYGTENYQTYLKSKALKLINNNDIIFPGFVEKECLRDYLNAADLFVMSSVHEAGPVSSMEALACETAVFTTDTGRVTEVLKENNRGLVVGPKNYKEWKYQIKRFIEGEEVQVMDREVARKHFSWEAIAKNFIRLYQKVK